MSWRCPWWRILKPVDTWIQRYAEWLASLVDLPVEIVRTLNLAVPATTAGAAFVPPTRPSIPTDSSSGQVFSSWLWRLVGEGGMALMSCASGALFGGVALFGAWYGIKEGYSSNLFWYFWGMIAAGIAYGAYAIALGVRELARLAWRWNAPLRTLKRPQ
jgi:hypothetical protein